MTSEPEYEVQPSVWRTGDLVIVRQMWSRESPGTVIDSKKAWVSGCGATRLYRILVHGKIMTAYDHVWLNSEVNDSCTIMRHIPDIEV